MSEQEITEQNVLSFIKARPGTTFVELENKFGKGDRVWSFDNNEHLILWVNVKIELFHVLKALRMAGKIEMRPTSSMTYLIDGAMLNVPIAKRARVYKKDHWLPVTFFICQTGGEV